MKNFLSYLTELFDRPFPYKTIRGGYGKSGQNVFDFDVNESERIRVIVELFDERLYLSFTANGGSIEMTGKGSAERILATVMQIMEKFLEHSTPDEIVFIAPTDSPARARVYEKMVGRYAKGFQYELVNTQRKPEEIWFTLSHEENVF